MTLIKKELQRFFTSANYLLNVGIGLILATIGSILLLLFGKEQLEVLLSMPGLSSMIQNFLPIVLTLFVGLSVTTPSSISIEGKNFWILKTIPMNPVDILLSKVFVTLVLTVPAILINGTILVIALRPSFIYGLFVYIVPILYAFFIACFGILQNLKHPNFEWTNEITVIKQSMPVFTTMMVGMLTPILLMSILSSGTIPSVISLSIILLILIVIDLYMYRLLRTRGVKQFQQIS